VGSRVRSRPRTLQEPRGRATRNDPTLIGVSPAFSPQALNLHPQPSSPQLPPSTHPQPSTPKPIPARVGGQWLATGVIDEETHRRVEVEGEVTD